MKFSNRHSTPGAICSRAIRFCTRAIRTSGMLALIAICWTPQLSDAQQSKHHLIRGDDAPGLAAQKMLLSNPKLALHPQPVRIHTPEGTFVSAWMGNGFGAQYADNMTAQMSIGPVYRLKISNLPRMRGKVVTQSLYPSIELLNKLNPPEGLNQQFPIEISITADDLKKAFDGHLVTKIIYLEDPATALPFQQKPDDQPYLDVSPIEDPIRVAEGMGRPMAILRIGSRIPDMVNGTSEFQVHPAPVQTMIPVTQNRQESPQGTVPPVVASNASLIRPRGMQQPPRMQRPVNVRQATPMSPATNGNWIRRR